MAFAGFSKKAESERIYRRERRARRETQRKLGEYRAAAIVRIKEFMQCRAIAQLQDYLRLVEVCGLVAFRTH